MILIMIYIHLSFKELHMPTKLNIYILWLLKYLSSVSYSHRHEIGGAINK